MNGGLARLLRPASIAVMGGKWAEAVVTQCLEMGYGGAIWPVHPKNKTVAGVEAFAAIEDLPEAPDAVFVGINRHATIDAIARLSALGAGGAIAFASGFAESPDGQSLQEELVAAAGDMPVLGPNCYGVINTLDGALLWPDVHGGRRVDRGVALIVQSSNLAINLTMAQGGLPVAYVATLGNQAMVQMADMVRAVASDNRVTAIGLYIEGIADAGDFADAVRQAKASGKPVVALKIGASEAGGRMALSHTASLAGSHQVASAFFKALGVGQVETIEAFLQTLGLLHCFGGLEGKSLLSLSCSGGEAALVADAAHRHNIPMPDFTEATKSAIAETVNPLVTVSNPFDYHTFDWGDEARLTATFTQALSGGFDINALVLDFPAPHIERIEAWEATMRAWEKAKNSTNAQAVVLASMAENMPQSRAESLMAMGIAPLMGFDTAMEAITAAHQASITSAFTPIGFDAVKGEVVTVFEAEAKARLAQAGIPVPLGEVVTSLESALTFAKNKTVVLKSVNTAHKSEEGGVFLGLDSPESVTAAWQNLTPPILIEEMITDSIAEIIIGIARDRVFGLYMVIGTGGVETEIWRDTATLMLPTSRQTLTDALSALKVMQLLNGFRGRPKGDITALMDCALGVANFAQTHHNTLMELDINPVLIRPKGVVAVDALMRMGGR